MISLKSVLVATDFSEASFVAIRYGRAIAEAFGATLHVVHVVPDSLALPWATLADGLSMGDVQRRWEEEARQRLEQLVPVSQRTRVRVQFSVQVGDPVRQITGYAHEHEIDLAVLGTHGRGAVAHMILGSVAERVVRSAPCPVLTVRHPQHEFVTDEVVALVPTDVPAAAGASA